MSVDMDIDGPTLAWIARMPPEEKQVVRSLLKDA